MKIFTKFELRLSSSYEQRLRNFLFHAQESLTYCSTVMSTRGKKAMEMKTIW